MREGRVEQVSPVSADGRGGKDSRKTLVKKYGPLSYSLSNLIHAEAGTELVYETA
jgi:hypothetical protein